MRAHCGHDVASTKRRASTRPPFVRAERARQLRRRLGACAAPALVVVLACALGSGCIEQNEEPLTCAWLASDNCWKEAIRDVQACAPAQSGRFDGSALTCSFSSGEQVRLDEPMSFTSSQPYLWSFELTDASGSCMSFETASGGGGSTFYLATGLGEVTVDESGASLSVSCPDGVTYQIDDTSELFDTCDSGLEFLPGIESLRSASTATFSLSGGANGSVQVFSCSR